MWFAEAVLSRLTLVLIWLEADPALDCEFDLDVAGGGKIGKSGCNDVAWRSSESSVSADRFDRYCSLCTLDISSPLTRQSRGTASVSFEC